MSFWIKKKPMTGGTVALYESGGAEKYVRKVKDMYESSMAGRWAAGVTDSFKVGVGLHQGSALSPFLFATVMDKMRSGRNPCGRGCLQTTL